MNQTSHPADTPTPHREPFRRRRAKAARKSLSVNTCVVVLVAAVLSPRPAQADPQDNTIAIAANNVLETIAKTGPSSSSTERVTAAAATTDSTYSAQLHVLADEIDRTVSIDHDALLQSWNTTDPRRLKVVLTALSLVGTPYRYGGNSPGGFDCSGLTSYAWGAVGLRIPRTSGSQIAATTPRTMSELQPGDLLWRPGHIGMSIGYDDLMVNATQTGKPVEVKRAGRIVRAGSPVN